MNRWRLHNMRDIHIYRVEYIKIKYYTGKEIYLKIEIASVDFLKITKETHIIISFYYMIATLCNNLAYLIKRIYICCMRT